MYLYSAVTALYKLIISYAWRSQGSPYACMGWAGSNEWLHDYHYNGFHALINLQLHTPKPLSQQLVVPINKHTN